MTPNIDVQSLIRSNATVKHTLNMYMVTNSPLIANQPEIRKCYLIIMQHISKSYEIYANSTYDVAFPLALHTLRIYGWFILRLVYLLSIEEI